MDRCVMEVSTKCLPKETFQVAGDFKAYLAGHGIVLGADQSAKTKTSLEFFSARLRRGGAGRLSDLARGGRSAGG